MPGLFFTTALRNLLRHKVQSFISLASLALGLIIFGFTFLYVKQELSYDHAWPEAERIHRLLVDQRGIPGLRDGLSSTVNARAHPALLDYFGPQIDKLTRLASFPARFKDAQSTTRKPLYFVDPEFADIFQLEVVVGDLRRSLSGPGFIALEENYAATLGVNLVPGDRVVIQSLTDAEIEYEVAAIYRLPQDISSSLRFEQLTLIHEYSLPLFGDQRRSNSWESYTQIWLMLEPDVDIGTFNEMQPAFIDVAVTAFDETLGPARNISDHLFYRWQPVTGMHFNPAGFEAITGAGDIGRVATFAIVGLLVLLVGCSNSVSLSLASAIERRRETGIRKTMGALPADILRQHLGESVLLALIALAPAIALLELLLPAFKTLLPFATQIDAGWNEYVLLALITIVVGLANGIYPALVLSDVRPQVVLKSGPGGNFKGGLSLRSLLVGAQFCFASILLIGTAALYAQLAVTRSQPLGFNPENLVAIFLNNELERANGAALRVELQKIPGVVRVVPIGRMPNENLPTNINTVTLVRESKDNDEIKPQMAAIDSGFSDILEIPLLAGRIPDPVPSVQNQLAQNATPSPPVPSPVAVNRTAARALGFASPEEAVEQIVFMRSTSGQDGRTFHGRCVSPV